MKETLLRLFEEHEQLAILISLVASVIIAILGVLPSVFITAANILFFGFWPGTLISFAGEAIGAGIAFLLYRKGFKKISQQKLQQFSSAQRLIHTQGKEAFVLILSLRLLPFVPSGIITFAAAIGQVSFFIFFLASSLGKIPALLIEAYSVEQVSNFHWQGKLILLLVALTILYIAVKKLYKK